MCPWSVLLSVCLCLTPFLSVRPQAEVARLLVQSGARIDIQNKAERTPLQMAPPGLARDLQQLAPPSV